MATGSNQIWPANGGFTLAQWQQLQLQQKVFRYIRARLRVPVDLIARLGCQHGEHNCCFQSHCFSGQRYHPCEIQGHVSRITPNGRRGSRRSKKVVRDQAHRHEGPNKMAGDEVGEPSQPVAPTNLQSTDAPLHDLSMEGSVDRATCRPSSPNTHSDEKTESNDLSISEPVDGTNNRSTLPAPSSCTSQSPSSFLLVLPLPTETPKGLAPFETENSGVYSSATQSDHLSIFQSVDNINNESNIPALSLPTSQGPTSSPLVLSLPIEISKGLAPFETKNADVDSSATESDDLSIPQPVDDINSRSFIPMSSTSSGPSSPPLFLALTTKTKTSGVPFETENVGTESLATESSDLSIPQPVDSINKRSSTSSPPLPTSLGPSSPLHFALPAKTKISRGLAPFEIDNAGVNSLATENDNLSIIQPPEGINNRSLIPTRSLPTSSCPSSSPLVLALPANTKTSRGLAPFETENAGVDSPTTESDVLSIHQPVDGMNNRNYSLITPSLPTSLGLSPSHLVIVLPTKTKIPRGSGLLETKNAGVVSSMTDALCRVKTIGATPYGYSAPSSLTFSTPRRSHVLIRPTDIRNIRVSNPSKRLRMSTWYSSLVSGTPPSSTAPTSGHSLLAQAEGIPASMSTWVSRPNAQVFQEATPRAPSTGVPANRAPNSSSTKTASLREHCAPWLAKQRKAAKPPYVLALAAQRVVNNKRKKRRNMEATTTNQETQAAAPTRKKDRLTANQNGSSSCRGNVNREEEGTKTQATADAAMSTHSTPALTDSNIGVATSSATSLITELLNASITRSNQIQCASQKGYIEEVPPQRRCLRNNSSKKEYVYHPFYRDTPDELQAVFCASMPTLSITASATSPSTNCVSIAFHADLSDKKTGLRFIVPSDPNSDVSFQVSEPKAQPKEETQTPLQGLNLEMIPVVSEKEVHVIEP
ncbi:nucleoporin NSP1-like [Nymphaea colorata]|nr:nucleoporin NSP1-like [Nymphaea colorata]